MLMVLLVGIGWLLSLCTHEFAHALMAYWGGDTSVKDKGYLSFNPFIYANFTLSLLIPLLILVLGGIALPGAAVFIDHSKLKGRLWESAVSLAGPIANLMLSWLFAFLSLQGVLDSIEQGWRMSLVVLSLFNALAFILNSLPVPPLDGFGVLEPWLPESIRVFTRRNTGWIIIMAIGAIFFFEPIGFAFWSFAFQLTTAFGAPLELVRSGLHDFTTHSRMLLLLLLGIWLLWRIQKHLKRS